MTLPIDSDNLKERIEQVLAEDIAPALQMDGGRIEVLEVAKRVVRVRLHGSCSGCPSTVMAIIMGIEQELRRRFPEVEYLETVPQIPLFPCPHSLSK